MVMPFGLSNAPTTFMDLMNRVFKEYLDKFVVIFINDILVYWKTWGKHKEHLRMVLQKLQEHQLYKKFSKCEFWLDYVAFLDHVILKERVKVDPIKVVVVWEWQ